jgi:hypothetical protein
MNTQCQDLTRHALMALVALTEDQVCAPKLRRECRVPNDDAAGGVYDEGAGVEVLTERAALFPPKLPSPGRDAELDRFDDFPPPELKWSYLIRLPSSPVLACSLGSEVTVTKAIPASSYK